MSDKSDDSRAAAGFGAVFRTLRRTAFETGPLRTARLLARINQDGGFACPGCAWPEVDPGDRSFAEFCENGAKAVSHEATLSRIDADFFREHSVSSLRSRDNRWLEAQGRLTQPMRKAPGSDWYQPIAWEEAFRRIGEKLARLSSPDQAVFYTSGRTSNEAAFLYQLFAREFGTNNLPDCSNMCHESSGTGLGEVIGVGKGTVGLDDFMKADAIFIVGQNPGTNHPRMLVTLQKAKERGAKIVSINPLRELGLVRFSNPQRPLELLGRSTSLSDLYIPVRIGGDIALLKGIIKHVFEAEAASPGNVLDHAFLDEFSSGLAELRDHVAAVSWEELEEESGITRAQMKAAADVYIGAKSVIACWAMGLTQHQHAVANVREITNLLLLRGNIGRPGAGVCPVRGHSNVQGDRTMGITEDPRPEFLDRLDAEFGITSPRRPGFDTVAALGEMLAGNVKVFVGMGGNFASATPDTARAAEALERCELTVHVSTKLNRSHVVTGSEAIILPTLGRTERDEQDGARQYVTIEDSMSMVHRSEGVLAPASECLRSEPAIVAELARATLGRRSRVPWSDLITDYDRIRERIERVVPGFERFNERVKEPGGFRLPNGARERRFATADGRARLTINPLTRRTLADGEFLLMTIRSHDQFNTTIYGLDDLYRGIEGARDVLFMNDEDIRDAGLENGARVDVTSRSGGVERSLRGLRLVAYEIPRRCLAAYFPEANVLVSLEDFADKSRTPAYKSIPVTISKAS
ncbi:MAG TPA: FdhF/YdeP family oxidoreductase [Candidatus Limnocylindrales bacterium]|nr:FdhF/YdeP family oxidoreductase [Candidatus Limnocylindrales bacterium]